MAAPRDSLRLELACFAALAAFAVLEWTSLVADPPTLRALLVVAIATGAGFALAALGRVELSRTARLSLILALAPATVALAMVAIGLPAELLLPGHWDELSAKLGRTLPGVGDVSTPYRGADGWTRLTILLAAPLTVVLAALAAFWPARRRFLGRLAALALLITLYVTAVASTTPGGELGRGLLLVILISAWLWLPGLAARRRGAGLLAIAAASAIALPLAALAPSRPLLDYRSWELLSTHAIGFDWDHSYGPLDWPQRGSLLFRVASDGAHYWKATNLDSFDGVVWRRSDSAAPEPPLGNVETLVGTGQLGGGAGPHPEWVDQINFEVRGLSSDVAIGAGTSLGVRGLVGSPTPDATWELSRGLRRGASYTVLAYTPEPSAAQMQAAPAAFPAAAGRYTAFSLPSGAGYVQAPFWRPDQDAALASRLAGSPYETTYDLARQVTTGAATPYEAARRLELYLRATYEYDQDPGEHTYPLPAFLFEDRRGYCQQFSGAMALMLRMIGIPSRVAGGFSPGGRDPQRGLFLVEDIDAHSWVEVYFTGIGWVPFEPTPAAAPAEAQLDDNAIGDTAGGPTVSSGETDPAPGPDASGGDTAAAKPQPQPLSDQGGDSGPDAGPVAGTAAVGIAIVLAGGYGLRSLRRRRLDPEALGERELNELVTALARLDRPLPAGATLLEAERRLEQLAGPEAGGYASALRERRYRLPSASPPGIAERRGLRRALLAASGWRRALAVLLAISPGGPAGRRH